MLLSESKGHVMTLDKLQEIPADAILGLMTAFRADPSSQKIDLTVGVYRDDNGNTPVMRAVEASEERLIQAQTTKSYISPLGINGYREGLRKTVLGPVDESVNSRTSVIQTPGGCGALRVAAELYVRTKTGDTAFMSDPTWGNHLGIMGAAGLKLDSYPYYNPVTHELEIDRMLDRLENIPERSLVILQASSHNPTGEDPSVENWNAIIDIVEKRNLVPLFDLAYQGLGDNMDDDVASVRMAAQRLPEMFVSVSCSKNFGLYRERTGALISIGHNDAQQAVLNSQAANIARGTYSMSPAHGPLIVAGIFEDEGLVNMWQEELTEMRGRINGLRNQFADALVAERPDLDTNWIRKQRGMFSLLGIPTQQVDDLRENQHIYMVRDSRINIAGFNDENIPVVAKAVAPLMS